VKGSGRGLTLGNPVIFLKGLSDITIADLLAKIVTLDLLNRKQGCYQLDCDLVFLHKDTAYLGLLHLMDVERVAYVSEVYKASISRIEASKLCEFKCTSIGLSFEIQERDGAACRMYFSSFPWLLISPIAQILLYRLAFK
jgi:hypothetical protein